MHDNIQPSFEGSSSSRIDLLEFACSSDSAIGRVSSELGINTVRLSLDIADLTTNKGLKYAVKLARANPKVSLHAAIPCTSWSSWNSLNSHKLGRKFRETLKIKREQSIIMLNNFITVSKIVVENGGHVSFEWPRYCSGWNLDVLQKCINKLKLLSVDF